MQRKENMTNSWGREEQSKILLEGWTWGVKAESM
jgi:hypothetical protein